MADELAPTFAVTAFLDGDDDARTQTANFAAQLRLALARMRADGYCVDFELERPVLAASP